MEDSNTEAAFTKFAKIISNRTLISTILKYINIENKALIYFRFDDVKSFINAVDNLDKPCPMIKKKAFDEYCKAASLFKVYQIKNKGFAKFIANESWVKNLLVPIKIEVNKIAKSDEAIIFIHEVSDVNCTRRTIKTLSSECKKINKEFPYLTNILGSLSIDNYPNAEKCKEYMKLIRTTCQKCNSKNIKLKICDKCKFIRYCSIECQKEGWENHKSLCYENNRLGLIIQSIIEVGNG